jgi:hypothetical protein
MGKERVLLLFLSRWNIDFAVCDDFDFQFYLKIKICIKKNPRFFQIRDSILYHHPTKIGKIIYLLTYITSLTALTIRSAFGRLAAINVGA